MAVVLRWLPGPPLTVVPTRESLCLAPYHWTNWNPAFGANTLLKVVEKQEESIESVLGEVILANSSKSLCTTSTNISLVDSKIFAALFSVWKIAFFSFSLFPSFPSFLCTKGLLGKLALLWNWLCKHLDRIIKTGRNEFLWCVLTVVWARTRFNLLFLVGTTL